MDRCLQCLFDSSHSLTPFPYMNPFTYFSKSYPAAASAPSPRFQGDTQSFLQFGSCDQWLNNMPFTLTLLLHHNGERAGIDTCKTISSFADRWSQVTELAFLSWYLGADSRGVAESVQTSLSHQPTIMEPKVKSNYNFLLLHLAVRGVGDKTTEALTWRLRDVFIAFKSRYNL